MVSIYRLAYHSSIPSDLKKLSPNVIKRIKKAIDSKLIKNPKFFGGSLKKPLKSYWKLRVGDYRIIFELNKKMITILIIGHRSKVYDAALKRLFG